MSTLTKVLIVLLSLSTIFISGIMVTFVATQQNYQEAYKAQKALAKAASDDLAAYDQRFAEKSFQMEELNKAHLAEKQALTAQITELTVARRMAETERDELKAKAASWDNTIKGFETTITNNAGTLKLTQGELDEARAVVINLKERLNELTATQYDKYVEVEQLKSQVKNLREAKFTLEKRIEALSGGKAPEPVETITQVYSQAKPAANITVSAPLKGVITEVGPRLVSISIGSADGVTVGTVFHVIRGQEFICNVKITNTDVDKAAGIIELEMEQPKVGDSVTTKL